MVLRAICVHRPRYNRNSCGTLVSGSSLLYSPAAKWKDLSVYPEGYIRFPCPRIGHWSGQWMLIGQCLWVSCQRCRAIGHQQSDTQLSTVLLHTLLFKQQSSSGSTSYDFKSWIAKQLFFTKHLVREVPVGIAWSYLLKVKVQPSWNCAYKGRVKIQIRDQGRTGILFMLYEFPCSVTWTNRTPMSFHSDLQRFINALMRCPSYRPLYIDTTLFLPLQK